jgi:thiamine transporter
MTLAVVTSIYTLIEFPFGGSITLFRMFFICFIGYLYGTKVGVLTGVAYGFLDLILHPYVIHPAQLFLDYPIAFGSLGLSGIFSKSKFGIIKGYTVGVIGRYLCHVITGVIFFYMYAGEKNPLVYSLIYNGSYIFPEAAVTILILSIPAVRNALFEVKRIALER